MQSVEKLVKADSKLAIQHANPQFYEKICQSDAKNACKELFQQMDWNKADIKEILYDVTPGKLRSTKDSKGKIQHGLISDIRGTLKKFTENKTKNGQTYQQKYPQLKASTIKQAINALEEYYTASQAGNAAKQQQARYSQSPAPSRTQSPLPRGTAAPSTQEKGKEPARSTSSTQEKGKEFLQLQQQIQMYHSKQEELKNLQNLQKQLEGSGGRQGGQQLSLLEAFRQNQQKKPAQRVEIQPLQEFPTTTQAQLQGIGAEPKQDIKGEIKTTFGQVLNKLSNNDPNKQKLQAFYDDLSDGKNFEPDEIIGVKGTLVDIQKNTSDQDFKNSIDYLSEKLTLLPAEYNSSQKNQSNFSSGSDTPPALPILPSAHLTQQDTGQTSRGNPPTLPIHPLAHLTQQDTGQMSQAIVNMLPTLRELHTPPSTPLPSPRQGNRGANSSDSDSI